MRSIFSKAAVTAIIASVFTVSAFASTGHVPQSDTTKMSKMSHKMGKMSKMEHKKMGKMKKGKMSKDTTKM